MSFRDHLLCFHSLHYIWCFAARVNISPLTVVWLFNDLLLVKKRYNYSSYCREEILSFVF